MEIGRIIYDILGSLNFWKEFFKKVNSLDMDGAMSQLWIKLGSNYVPRDILEISAIWEGKRVLLFFLWENMIEHLFTGQMGEI